MTNEQIKAQALKVFETKLVSDLNTFKDLALINATRIVDAIFATQDKAKAELAAVPNTQEAEPAQPDSVA